MVTSRAIISSHLELVFGSIFAFISEAIERRFLERVGADGAPQPERKLHPVDVAVVGEIQAILDGAAAARRAPQPARVPAHPRRGT